MRRRVYAYLINRKLETRKGETARKAVKKFKVVYEWSVQTALELSSAVRKKQAQVHTPCLHARPLSHSLSRPHAQPPPVDPPPVHYLPSSSST